MAFIATIITSHANVIGKLTLLEKVIVTVQFEMTCVQDDTRECRMSWRTLPSMYAISETLPWKSARSVERLASSTSRLPTSPPNPLVLPAEPIMKCQKVDVPESSKCV